MKSSPTRKSKNRGSRPQTLLADRYELIRELGRGGAGVVHLARDRKMQDRMVALKTVALRGQDPFLLASLKNEFATLTQLSHPHLAKVHDFGTTEREIFLSSEWVDGVDVLTASREMNLNTVFQVLLQTLRAIDYLHRRGVLHLDLKPANILVTDPKRTGEARVVLIDFGLARLFREPAEKPEEFSGTPPYSAPELLLGKEPAPASDIYSLGILCHRLFAKTLPFRSEDPLQILQEQISGTPLRVTSLHPALPEDFSDILWKMVQKEPEERFPTPGDLLAAINRSLGESFSLRPNAAPAKILEESDYRFRREIFEDLLKNFLSPAPTSFVLRSAPHRGAGRLLRGLKESLQLNGVFPIRGAGKESLKEFLSASAWPQKTPFFLDRAELTPEEAGKLSAQARRFGTAFLLAVREGRDFQALPEAPVLEISPLEPNDLREFLQKEILSLPESWRDAIVAQSRGFPRELELILQALREEGALQWSDRGWCWVEGTTGDLETLQSAHRARWEERRYRILDFLKFSSLSWSAVDLAGILGLAPEVLEEKLREWVDEGALHAEVGEGPPLYRPVPGDELRGPAKATEDWNRVETELLHLYDHGHYRAGAHWADLLLARFSDKLPLRVRLLGARHYVAQGQMEKGLQTLAESSPQSPSERGLFHEIRSRAAFHLGKDSEAEVDLAKAKQAYEQARDRPGLARAWNLEGSLKKKAGNHPEAEAAYRQAVREAEAGKNLYIQAVAEMNLATLHHDRGEFEAAAQTYRRVAELSEKVSHPTLACLFRHNWVNLLYHMGRSQEAEAVAYEWLRLAVQNDYVSQQAAALNYLALLSGQKSQRERQLAYFNRAIALLEGGAPSQFLFQTLINRGYAYWGAENYPAAQLDAEAALQAAERSHHSGLSPWAHLLLGKIHRDRSKPDYAAARSFLETAHAAIRAGGRKQLLWEVQLDFGLLAKREGNLTEAAQRLRAAQEILEELKTGMPETERQSFLRDRKMERVLSELEGL